MSKLEYRIRHRALALMSFDNKWNPTEANATADLMYKFGDQRVLRLNGDDVRTVGAGATVEFRRVAEDQANSGAYYEVVLDSGSTFATTDAPTLYEEHGLVFASFTAVEDTVVYNMYVSLPPNSNCSCKRI